MELINNAYKATDLNNVIDELSIVNALIKAFYVSFSVKSPPAAKSPR